MIAYYACEYDGEEVDTGYSTEAEAMQGIDYWWGEYNDDADETRCGVGYIVGYDDEEKEVFRKKVYLEHTFERSDYEEHRSY